VRCEADKGMPPDNGRLDAVGQVRFTQPRYSRPPAGQIHDVRAGRRYQYAIGVSASTRARHRR
jgi:hypothetical protein